MYFLLIYDLVDDYIEKRTPYRPQHFEHVKAAQARGEFVMGGLLTLLTKRDFCSK